MDGESLHRMIEGNRFMHRSPQKGIPENFALTESTSNFMQNEFPTVDVEKTLALFRDKAEAGGWLYASWQAAFRNYVRNGQKYGGIAYKNGRAQDPRWQPILAIAKPYGFREPEDNETPSSYRTAFEQWKSFEKRSTNVLPFDQEFARRFGR